MSVAPEKLHMKSQGAFETWIEGNKAYDKIMEEKFLGPTSFLICPWICHYQVKVGT